MAVQVQCPYCCAIYSVYEAAVGRRVRCPDCHQLVTATRYEPPPGSAPAATPGEDEIVDLAPVEEEPVELLPVEESVRLTPPRELPPDATPPAWDEPVQPPPLPPPPPPLLAAESRTLPSPATDRSTTDVSATEPCRKAVIFRERRRRAEADIDMTPMVDVVFQLLIFFMLTASFSMQKSLQVPKPEKSGQSQQPQSVQEFLERPEYIVVRVDGFNTYHVNAAAFEEEIEAPSEQELLVKLRQARQGDARGNIPTKMLVVASGEALHQRVVTALDAGNEIGMEEVQLVTIEDDD